MSGKYKDAATVREALSSPVPSVNPVFCENGDIDWEKTKGLIDFFIETGSKALLITYGDSLLSVLDDEEIYQLNKLMTDTAAGRAMTIACGGCWDLKRHKALAEAMKDAGADLYIPYFPDWAQSADAALLTGCFKEIGKIMPVMLLTAMGGRGIPYQVFDALSPNDGIFAVKNDTPMPYSKELGYRIRDKFAYLSGGTASFFLEEYPYGADGYLSVYARCFPEVSDLFWKTFKENGIKESAAVIEKYELPVRRFWDKAHFAAVTHAMQEIAGVGSRYRRTPYSSLTDAQMEELKALLCGLNVK